MSLVSLFPNGMPHTDFYCGLTPDDAADVVEAGQWQGPYEIIKGLREAGVGNLAGQRVLDVGVGAGTLSALFRAKGAGTIIGADLSDTMLDAARGKGFIDEKFFGNITHTLQPLKDGSFDVTAAGWIFPHIEHPKELIAEMVRVTRCGGLIGVNIYPSADSRTRESFKSASSAVLRAEPFAAITSDYHHDTGDIDAAFADAGAEIGYKNINNRGLFKIMDGGYQPVLTTIYRRALPA